MVIYYTSFNVFFRFLGDDDDRKLIGTLYTVNIIINIVVIYVYGVTLLVQRDVYDDVFLPIIVKLAHTQNNILQ